MPKIKGKIELAYTAGIIDGEGCIMLGKAKSLDCRLKYRYQLVVTVGSIDEWLPQWLKFRWGGNIVYQKPLHMNHSPSWRWQIMCRQAQAFLENILPYLNLKRPQAEIAIRFQKAKCRRRGKSDEELAVEEAQVILITQYKNKCSPRRRDNPI